MGSQQIILQIVLNLVLNAEQALTGWPSATLRMRTRRQGPAEELIVVFMTQLLPSGTFNFRGQLEALVYPAIVD